MKWKQIFFITAIILIFSNRSVATITIDSVTTTLSSCSNNGVAIVFASSNIPGPLLYAITSGPILAPIQNSNIFSSLFPGNYNLRVYDVNFDSTDYQFQIAGNYQLPEFSLLGVDPTCPGFTDGSINAIVDSTKGLPPFTYEITAPIVVPPQSSGFFSNLVSNTYFVRVTDACGNYQTRTEVLFNTGTALGTNNFIVPSVLKIGCDTIKVSSSIYLYKEKWNQPINVTYNTSSGPITKQATLTVVDTINYAPGLFDVTDTLSGLTYGDYLNVVFTDVCGVSVSSGINTIAPFDFEIIFSPTTINCVSTFSGSAQLKQFPYYPFDFTSPMVPLSFIMTDATTGTVVDSGGCGYQYCGISLIPQVPGNLYNLTITDGCGEVWQETIMWPTAGLPHVNIFSNYGCMDSTATLTIECLGFQSATWITFLSGPANATSTKPFYAYNDTLVYPQTFYGAVSPNVIYVKDFPVGLYTFIVEDSCGNSIPGTFLVENYMVSNLNFTWFVKPSCLNNNTLFYNFQEGTAGAVFASITDLSTNQVVAYPALNYFLDSLTTFATGTYALEIYYLNHLGNGQYFDGGLIHSGNSCWVLHDTITISPYTNNYFITNSTVYCNGNYYVALEVDSSRGVPPYQFAIISGPQTFPLQDSAFFQITAFGNYTISMEDACGNNYTQQISVTSDSLPPIVRGGYFCEGNNASLTFGSSPYFTTVWSLPNGSSVSGDSLIFQPFTAADTGQYIATTVVSINGCLDSLTSVFYLSGKDSVIQTFLICPGDSIYVGSNVYTVPGVYRDTVATVLGCDSVLITTISLQVTLVDSTVISICSGDSIMVGNNYYSSTGIYMDTVYTGNCLKIIITDLTVDFILDSISVMLCQGDTFMVGNILHQTAGIFTDTLTAASGCDSVLVVSISIAPVVVDSNTVSICFGDSLLVGNNYYSSTGIFMDTVYIGNCQKIIITDLTIDLILDSISVVLCPGDTFMVGNILHQTAGIFTDTLTAASGCDSVLVVSISLTPIVVDSNTISICFGDSLLVGNNYYSSTGIYMDTVITGNCQKVIITDLTVNLILDSISVVLCQGDTFMVGNIIHQSAGIFTDTLTAASGCDSLVVVSISITPIVVDSNTVSICYGDSLLVGNNYYSSTGIYMDTVITGNCQKVIITDLTVDIILDSINVVLCQGDTFMVGNIIHQTAGIFTDTLTAASGCDSLVISTITILNGGASTLNYVICSGDSIYFGNSFVNVSGTYFDTLSTVGCDSIIELQLTVLPAIPIAITADTSLLLTNGSVQLNSIYQPDYYYNWTGSAIFNTPLSNSTNAILDSSTWVYLTIADSFGCVVIDSVWINFTNEQPLDSCESASIFIPNAFTPNNDGLNDSFEIITNNLFVVNYTIFNRWGQTIFESSKNEKKWNGYFRNGKCPSGVYIYFVKYENCLDKKIKVLKGSLMLFD